MEKPDLLNICVSPADLVTFIEAQKRISSPTLLYSSCSSFSEKVPNFRSIFFKWVWAWFFIQLSLHLHILFTAAPPPSHQLNSSTGYSTSLPGSSGHSSFNETSRQARVGSLASVYRVHIAQSRDVMLDLVSLLCQISQASRDYTISAPLLMNIRAKFRQKRPFPTALATVLESFNCSCRPKAFERVPSRNWDKIFPQCSYQLHTPYLK